jgi:hypothetical protein
MMIVVIQRHILQRLRMRIGTQYMQNMFHRRGNPLLALCEQIAQEAALLRTQAARLFQRVYAGRAGGQVGAQFLG